MAHAEHRMGIPRLTSERPAARPPCAGRWLRGRWPLGPCAAATRTRKGECWLAPMLASLLASRLAAEAHHVSFSGKPVLCTSRSVKSPLGTASPPAALPPAAGAVRRPAAAQAEGPGEPCCSHQLPSPATSSAWLELGRMGLRAIAQGCWQRSCEERKRCLASHATSAIALELR